MQRHSVVAVALLVVTVWIGQGQSWAQGDFEDVNLPSLATIESRVDGLIGVGVSVPESQILQLRELDAIEREIDNLRYQASRANGFADLVEAFQKTRARFDAALSELGTANCTLDTSQAERDFADRQRRYEDAVKEIQKSTNWQVDVSPFYGPFNRLSSEDDAAYCASVRTAATNNRNLEGMNATLETVRTQLENAQTTATEFMGAQPRLLESLTKRLQALRSALNSATAQDTISENLPWIVLFVGAFSVATMAGVRLFREDIQLEWVASGQVIQFITVMILLSAIMVLGLSSILQQDTLGTLLGGIAGYVLAQGVGRAAARAVAREGDAAAQRRASPKSEGNTPGPPEPMG